MLAVTFLRNFFNFKILQTSGKTYTTIEQDKLGIFRIFSNILFQRMNTSNSRRDKMRRGRERRWLHCHIIWLILVAKYPTQNTNIFNFLLNFCEICYYTYLVPNIHTHKWLDLTKVYLI
jgi:hypothetical protein